jgi:4-aminobutyrate aminotransferase-like enzyme
MTTTAHSASTSASTNGGPVTPGPHSHGQALQQSPALAAAVDAIVREVRTHSAQITDIRGPRSDAAKQSYESLMARAADVRGRALLYPYLASGLGNGALVELADGSVKWDMIAGIGVHFLGHSDPGLIAATVRAGTSDIVNHGNLQSGFEVYQFGETLLRLAKRQSRLAHVYCSTSGAMANENALKVCYQKHAPASRVLAFKDCFMGRSVTMSQIGDAAANRQGIPLSTLVDYMPFYDEVAASQMGQAKYIDMAVGHLTQYIERYPRQHACFIFELVQGEGGFNTGPRDYFKALMDVCKASNIAVWDDEIQTFGRTEQMFAYEMLDLGQYVDVFCIGKMTQACATLYTAEYNPQPGLLSGTFVSGPSQFAAGIEVLNRLENGPGGGGSWYGKDGAFATHWRTFKQHVDALVAKHPAWFPSTSPKWGQLPPLAGGVGGMMKFTPFGGDKDKVNKTCKMMFEEGVMSFIAGHGPYHVRMLPPLPVFNEKDWPRVFACIEKGLAKAAQ